MPRRGKPPGTFASHAFKDDDKDDGYVRRDVAEKVRRAVVNGRRDLTSPLTIAIQHEGPLLPGETKLDGMTFCPSCSSDTSIVYHDRECSFCSYCKQPKGSGACQASHP